MRKRLRCPPPTLHSVATHRGGGTRTGVERQCQGRRRCPHFGGAGCPGGAGRGWGSIRRLQPENGQVNHAFVAAAPFPSSRRLHFLYIRLHSRIPERR